MAFAKFITEIIAKDHTQFVFLDETSTFLHMSPALVRSLKGTRAKVGETGIRKKHYTLLAAMTLEKVISPFVFQGTVNSSIFLTWLEELLCPELKVGMTVIMDNLKSHKSDKVKELIESTGAELVYLPPYSPL